MHTIPPYFLPFFEKLKGTKGTKRQDAACKKWGMKLNGAKCKIITLNDQTLVPDGSEVEKVKEIVFLGSVVPN